MKKLFETLRAALARGEDAVLVTIVASSGSAPRGTGARMLVTAQGRVCGTIGGGAVEYKGEQLAAEILQTKRSRQEHFRLFKNDGSAPARSTSVCSKTTWPISAWSAAARWTSISATSREATRTSCG